MKYIYSVYIKNKSMLRVIKPIRYLMRSQLYNGSFPSLIIGITYKCTSECPHCAVHHLRKGEKELTTNEIKSVINQAIGQGAFLLSLTGGEPMLREDLIEIVKYASSNFMLINLNTDGCLLTEKKIVELKENGLDLLSLSIDSPYPNIHDKLRNNEGCFDKIKRLIAFANKIGLFTQISTYATKQNINNGELKQIIELGRKLGSAVRVIPFVSVRKNVKSKYMVLDKQSYKKLHTMLDPPFVHKECIFSTCPVMMYIYVSPYGDVQPCPFMHLSFGNVRHSSFKVLSHKLIQSHLFKRYSKTCYVYDEDFCNNFLKNRNGINYYSNYKK